MTHKLYPLKFKPIFKEKIWGGQKINTILGKDHGDLSNCGESWEISTVKGNISEVGEGVFKGITLTELIQTYKSELVGSSIYKKYKGEFPLLIKFIDAEEDLSIQVHPNDKLAKQRHNSFGKTEMWYVLQADEGASLISGFNKELTKEEYLEYFKNSNLDKILNREIVQKDDVFYLPAGRVHTIGKGLMIAEIQQTSDVTYRIYDFDRVDDKGNKRELHVNQALEAIDFKHYDEYKVQYNENSNEPQTLVDSQYFTTNRHLINNFIEKYYLSDESFVIYIIVDGLGEIYYNEDEKIDIKKGDVVLIPACIQKVRFKSLNTINLLEVMAH